MFPNLSDLINALLGTHLSLPVKTYGFFLACGFIAGGIVLRAELRRKEKEGLLKTLTKSMLKYQKSSYGEILLASLFSALIGFKFIGIITSYNEFSVNPGAYLVSAKGNIWAALIILLISIGYAIYKNKKIEKLENETIEVELHPYNHTWSILIVAVVAALIGSKVFDLLDNFQSFLANPVSSITSFSGLTFYGGLLFTVPTLIYYMRLLKLDWKYVIDASAPAIMLGYAIGRMGCHMAGDGCWGIINTMAKPGLLSWLPDAAWANYYPHNAIHEGIRMLDCTGSNCTSLEYPVWPTSLYESLISLVFFFIIWLSRKKMKAPVTVFGLFMILNGFERFFIEKIRVNHRYHLLGMNPTQAEIISFLLVTGGMLLIWFYTRRYRRIPG